MRTGPGAAGRALGRGAHPYLPGLPRLPPPRSPALSRSRSSGSRWPSCSSLSRAQRPGHRSPRWPPAPASGEPTGTPGTRYLPSAAGAGWQGSGKKAEQAEKAQAGLTLANSSEGKRIFRGHFPQSLEDPWGQLGQSQGGRRGLFLRQKDEGATATARRCLPGPPSLPALRLSPGQTHLLQFARYLFLLVILKTEGTGGEGHDERRWKRTALGGLLSGTIREGFSGPSPCPTFPG